MTKQEFETIVNKKLSEGYTEEDIAKAICLWFRDGGIDRAAFETLLNGMGYELSEELKAMSDEELREAVLEDAPEE